MIGGQCHCCRNFEEMEGSDFVDGVTGLCTVRPPDREPVAIEGKDNEFGDEVAYWRQSAVHGFDSCSLHETLIEAQQRQRHERIQRIKWRRR